MILKEKKLAINKDMLPKKWMFGVPKYNFTAQKIIIFLLQNIAWLLQTINPSAPRHCFATPK